MYRGWTGQSFSALIWTNPTGIAHGLSWLGIHAQAGAIYGFGSGLISEYQGGKGQLGDILMNAAKNAATGAITRPFGEAGSDILADLFALPSDTKPYYIIDGSTGEHVLAPSTEGLRKITEALDTTPAQIIRKSFLDTVVDIYGDKLKEEGRHFRIP